MNAVYTADDCFSDGLDNMEPGKCYSLNPDRGTQYGWINNNAQDRWWWVEKPCGGDSGGSDGCPDNSFLQKKSIFEKDSDYAKEDISYEIWKDKTQLFYDALGHKTQIHPKVRRFLFVPKKKALNYEPSYWQFGTISFVLKTTIAGFVDAEHEYIAKAYPVEKTGPCDCPKDVAWTDLKVSLSIETTIKENENQNNPLLKIHEDKHTEIYNSLGNSVWEKTVKINYCQESYESICSRAKQEVRTEFENKLRILIDAQNKWDDDDINNVSHERINLQEKLNEMYQKIYDFKCPQVQ